MYQKHLKDSEYPGFTKKQFRYMNIKINGEDIILKEQMNLSDFVKMRLNTTEPKGVAVAMNDTIIPKSKWKDTVVNENDNIEIVHAVQGG